MVGGGGGGEEYMCRIFVLQSLLNIFNNAEKRKIPNLSWPSFQLKKMLLSSLVQKAHFYRQLRPECCPGIEKVSRDK